MDERREVVVIVGSESDLPKVKASGMCSVLDEVLGHGHWEVTVMSADRNPEKLENYCRRMYHNQGTKVFIGIAGSVNALAPRISQILDHEPVVISAGPDSEGIPGLACLLSMTESPKGKPNLTTGVGAAAMYHAAINACRVIAVVQSKAKINILVFLNKQRSKKPVLENHNPDLIKEK